MLIQKQLIENMGEDLQEQVRTGFAILAATGIWLTHIQLEQDNILKGSESEDPAALAVRILEARKRVNVFTELQTLGLRK